MNSIRQIRWLIRLNSIEALVRDIILCKEKLKGTFDVIKVMKEYKKCNSHLGFFP